MAKKERLVPTGQCWCGCGEEAAIGSFFRAGHDKKAEAALVRIKYGSIAEFLHEEGYGPGGRNAIREAAALLEK